IEKRGHDLKFHLAVLKWHGLTVRGKIFDSRLAHSLIEPDQRHTIDYLSEVYLGYSRTLPDTANPEKIPDGAAPDELALRSRADCAIEYADLALQLCSALEPFLRDKRQERVFYEIEAPLLPVLVDMEFEG